MIIIKIEATETGLHLIQEQSHRTEIWEEGYVEVPETLRQKVQESKGYCDLIISNEVLTNITLNPIPPEPEPSGVDLYADNKTLKAQVTALSDNQDFYENCIVEMATIVYA